MRKFGWIAIMTGICLTACGPSTEQKVHPGAASLTVKASEVETTAVGPAAETTVSESEVMLPDGVSPLETRQLTTEELRQFEEFLNQEYGFLLSDYDSPESIDLDEVFYSVTGKTITEEEKKAYLQAIGGTEIETDMNCLSTAQIDEILVEKTGYHLKDMKNGLSWIYLPEYDCYYNEHGDTNIQKFICENGTVEGDTYKIRCMADVYTSLLYECVVTLKKTGSGYLFISNRVEWDAGGSIKPNADQLSIDGMRLIAKDYREKNGQNGAGYGESLFDSDQRYYTENELEQLKWNQKMMSAYRNEIYARRGYIFNSGFWNEFFGAYTWYQGEFTSDTFDPDCFNEYEKANLKLAVEMEVTE